MPEQSVPTPMTLGIAGAAEDDDGMAAGRLGR
jgi:hypothetical protein